MSSPLTDYSSLFYLSPFPNWVYDLTTFEILDVNQAAIDHYGYSREEFLGLTIKDLRPKEEIPVVLAAHANISQQEGNIYFGIFTHQKKSGELIRMKIHGHKVDFSGRKCMVVVCQNVTEEERQAQAIKESEERLKTAASIAKLGYWRHDLVTDTLIWSEEIFKIWGRERSTFEVNFNNFFESIHPADKKAFEVAQRATFEGGKNLDHIHRIILPDGSIKWVHELARLVRNDSGIPIILEGTVQDVTHQKEEEQRLNQISEQLLESEANFRTIFEIASLGIAQVDPAKGKIILVNSFYETITGYTTEELLQMNFVELTHPDDRERDWEIFSKALRGEGEYRNEKRYIRKDGSIVWVRLHVAFIKDELGKPIRTVAICEDISYRKAEEQRLKLLESVITNTSDSVMITEAEPFDEPGPRIVYVNEAFTKMTGYSAEEVIGKTPRILQGPKSDNEQLAQLGRALRNWEPYEITTLNYKKNGEEFWINFSVTPVANEKGWFTHWIAIERDVTEKKNQELEQNFLTEISRIFNEEKKLGEATQKLCHAFADFGQFDFVEVWIPTQENSRLQMLSFSHHSEEASEFYRLSAEFKQLNFEEVLPGLVWNTKEPILWNIEENSDKFLRILAANQSGIKSIFGIPLLFQEKIVGVLIFGSIKETSKLKYHIPIFRKLETFIGSEINRKSLETNLSHLFEAIPDIICLFDFQERFLKMNNAGYALLGYSEEELLHHYFDEFVHPEDKDVSTNEIKRLREGESTFQFENRYLTKNGEIIWLSWTCSSGVEEGVIYASAKNITSEKKLRELNSQASSLARIGSWELDVKEGKLFWTKMVHELHETDSETFIPDVAGGINFYREDFREMVGSSISKCIAEGVSFNFEAVLVTAKNNERWVRVIGSSEFLDGKCIRIFGSFQDIHDIKESENRLKSLANNLPGVVFQYVIHPDGTDSMRYVSKGAKEIWGYSSELAMSNNNLVWDQIKAGGDIKEVQNSIAESIQNRSKWTSKWRYILPSGELRIHTGQGSPEFLTDGTIIFNSLILDITEEKKTEELLKQVSKMAKVGSWELDLINQSGDTMYWSPMTRQILEVDESYNPSLSGGMEFYVGESKSQMQHAVELLIQNGEDFDLEVLLKTSKGNYRWTRCIGKSERIHGKCVKIFGSFQDIHQSKSLEIQIREILGSISDAFYALDKDWNFTYFNKEAENLLLKKASDVLGKNIWQEFPATIGTELEEIYHRVARSEKSESFEYLFPGDDNWYEINVYPSHGGLSSYFKNITQRKKANAEIAKSEEKRRLIMNGALDAIISIDTNETITFWNSQAGVIFGWEAEEVMGKPLSEIIIPEPFRRYHVEGLKNYLKTGEGKAINVLLELSALRRNGEEFPIELTVIPIKQGGEEFFCAFIRDITQRKNSEKELLNAYLEKNNILESIGDAFFSVTKDWIVTYWNKEAEHVLGKQRDNIVGKNLWEEYADAIDTDFYRQYHKAMDTQTNQNFEEYYPTLDKWFEVSAYPSSSGLSVYFKDVTLRKQADIRLIKANERFEKATEATNDAIWDWDIENKTYVRSKGIEKFFGRASSKTLDEDDFWTDKFHPQDLPNIRQGIETALQNPENKRWEMEYRIFKENGEIGYVLDKGLIIRNKKGKAIRMVGAMTDISDRKKHEEELLKLNDSLKKYAHELELTNEQLEQFAFIASHDLQEPLRMISSFLDQLRRKYGEQLDGRANQYIHFATDGAKRMKQIILDLLEYSRAGKFNESLGKIHLEHLLNDYKLLRKKVILEKSAIFVHPHLPIVEGYRAPFTQVLHCLMDNALKYSQEGISPKIELGVEETVSEWIFSIRDNGIGIDPIFFDKIFIIFQRLHNRDRYEGTGIGLSIVKKQVESWGGKIWLESTLGEGSTFYFTHPRIS